MRKNQPYEIYNKVPFRVPVGTRGDCYDRYLMRMMEMRQSLRIMMYCLKFLPRGDVKSNDHKFVPPLR